MTGRGISTRTALIERLVNKAGGVRSEATIQSDVRMLLLDPEFDLADDDLEVQLEAPVGHGRRIDVEVGCTVIEVKKSLSSSTAVQAATEQLAGYVRERAAEMGQRYVGILTDGRMWIAFHEVDGELTEATRHSAAVGTTGIADLLRWLEGVLATRKGVRPTPNEIAERLGAASSSHALDYSTLKAIYAESRDNPTVKLKRELWADLLRSALGTQFTNSDELFLEHTLLVNSAEIIAHLVLGIRADELTPATLLSGDQFAAAGLHGVVDRDFFDWVIEVEGGSGFITALARRLSRFDWSAVEHDVLKVLYESVISAETRKALGEYYTPDWLASQVINQVVTDPQNQRVLDPSCGSGTFVFYAVRRFLSAADANGVTLKDAMSQVTSRVMGIDLHPVAVALARVTYLLALGRDRLNSPERGTMSVPIYLGDSLGWDQREDLMSFDQLVIPTEVGDQLLSGDLRFSEHLLDDAARFDELVEALVNESGRAAGKSTNRLSEGTVRRLALAEGDLADLNANFRRLKELHEADRNHIWSYYIRNVSRPAWLSRRENRVDVLVGNPPWLSYRNMTDEMQRRFKTLAQDRGFWHNENTATHQDLAGVFVARAVERYLKSGGRLAFVVPNSVVDRDYWSGFRMGRFDGANVAFDSSWDLRRIRPHMFPRGSAVIFGTRGTDPRQMPLAALIWTGSAPHRHASLLETQSLRQTMGELSIGSEDAERSPYAARFAQGAILVPRLMFRVQETTSNALGVPAGRHAVKSRRSTTEKKPWKNLPDLTGSVETEFVWPVLLGEQLLPYRVLPPEKFVIPLTRRGRVLEGTSPEIDAYPGLASWTRNAEEIWTAHSSAKMTLAQQIDHMSKLTQQLPPASLRVVYPASGMHLAGGLVDDSRVLIDSKLYWAAVTTRQEGMYLVGILNSPITTTLVRPLMSYGKDERDIHKHVWKLPIPAFNPDDETHARIAALAEDLAETVADHEFDSTNFVTMRREVRNSLAETDVSVELNQLVADLLDSDEPVTLPSNSAPPSPGDTLLIRTNSGNPLPAGSTSIVEIDVDCEFDRSGRVYLWGATVTGLGEPATYHCFGSATPDLDEEETADAFTKWLIGLIDDAAENGQHIAWYHYGRTEVAQLQRLAPAAVDRLLPHAIDLLNDVVRPGFYGPSGYGLKHLAPAAGATWRTEGATGADTLDWIEQAREGDEVVWKQLVEYNEDDTLATKFLRRRLSHAVEPGWTLNR